MVSTVLFALLLCAALRTANPEGVRVRGGRIEVWTGSNFETCNCNGKSNRCYFDQELWQRTGSGGHCLECGGNTDGPNCEKCKDNYYQTLDSRCVACNCDPTGSISLQCNSQGQCLCKPGVEGQRCDRCAANHYDFSVMGCKSCGCNQAGSFNNTATCHSVTGQCRCKANVEGQHCDLCKPGFFDLQTENEFGCLPCFCFGHSSECISAPGYTKYEIESTFSRDSERWIAKTERGDEVPFQYNAINGNIGITSASETVYFVAPEKYLGDQRASYNQFLVFTLRIGRGAPQLHFTDVSLEGSGMRTGVFLLAQGNPEPSSQNQQFRFRLHEDASYGWGPKLSAKNYLNLLANLTALKIRGTYNNEGIGFLDDVRLESAQQVGFGPKAHWVEMCKCPPGYLGQFCESCAPGFRHDPPRGGNFAKCVPCNCNSHADLCDSDTGQCICKHNTAGDNCEKCADGFYGRALTGTENDCAPCPCPDNGPCVVLPDEQVACLHCPLGYAGHRCDLCVDGFYGDPLGGAGTSRLCNECECNNNVDPNAVGNCNTTTGECLKCIYNTGGSRCERCLPGFYGDALASTKGNCRPCGCHHDGTIRSEGQVGRTYDTAFLCDSSGQCACKPNVMGRQCDRCVDGYFNMTSGFGCDACNCHPVGSLNRTCDVATGQCHCRPGITGRHCDQCLPLHYGFSSKGCQLCECDRIGSTGSQCDDRGQCPCRPNVEGRRCERCRENKHNKAAGCVDCPVCYTLVQDAVTDHRKKLDGLSNLLDEIERNPQVVEDVNFQTQLESISYNVNNLLRDATQAQGADGSIVAQLAALRNRIQRVKQIAAEVNARVIPISTIVSQGDRNITIGEELIDQAQKALTDARKVLETEGRGALEKARERSKKFGQQSERMSEIARQARQLADKHEQEAETIEKLAKDALTTSDEAFRLALDAIQTQENNRLELERLQKDLTNTVDLMLRTKKMADEAKKEATKAYKDALEIYASLNSINVPSLESDKLRSDANDLIGQAERILREADELLVKNADVLNNTDFVQQDARDLLAEAIRQQRITDGLLDDAFTAHAKANDSISAGEATLTDAKNTLKTLKDFDDLVQASKGKAMEALKKHDSIKDMINSAQDKTTSALDALSGALHDAIEARDVALEAQKIAEKASKDSDKIREEADSTKTRAAKLKTEAAILTGSVEETGTRLKEYEDQANNDEKLAKDALERVNQAKTSAYDADSKVNRALQTVKGITGALDDVQDIDASLLNELERRLEEAELELRNANLDARLGTLKEAREDQKGALRNYDAEIERLKADVANVKAIKEAIPSDCYRRVRLEP